MLTQKSKGRCSLPLRYMIEVLKELSGLDYSTARMYAEEDKDLIPFLGYNVNSDDAYREYCSMMLERA